MSAAERPLPDLRPGQSGVIARLSAPKPWLLRLMELGLLPGTSVQLVRCAPLGDPLEIRVRGYSLSLRRSEAADVLVRSQ
jgi:ferrous iron transport protein A